MPAAARSPTQSDAPMGGRAWAWTVGRIAGLIAGLIAALTGCGPKQGPIAYAVVSDDLGEQTLTLDVARPPGPGPHPAVMLLHAGGWSGGHLYEWDLRDRMSALADAGFVAVTVEYRLTADRRADGSVRWPWPAQASDVRCAVRWVRANAAHLEVDPARIGALGWSAGGHLALILALAPDADDLDDGSCPHLGSPAAQAAASRSGPADLVAMPADSTPAGRAYLRALLDLPEGADPRDVAAAYSVASPLHRRTGATAPVLQQQGLDDPIVPPSLARRLDQALRADHHPAWLVEFAQVGHLWIGGAAATAAATEQAFLTWALDPHSEASWAPSSPDQR